jgi:hypothetical protein
MLFPEKTKTDRKGATHHIVAAVVDFIFKAVLFYTGWHLLARYNVISSEPSSGWLWLLAVWAITSELDRLTDDLEAQRKASSAPGFWGPYRRRIFVNVVEAVGLSTVIYHLGWLSIVSVSDYLAFLTGGVIVCVSTGITGTAGRLRNRPWLAAINDFEKGAACGAFLPALAFVSLWGWPSHEVIWYGAIGLCAAIGGGVNLWSRSRHGRELNSGAEPSQENVVQPAQTQLTRPTFLLPLREKEKGSV